MKLIGQIPRPLLGHMASRRGCSALGDEACDNSSLAFFLSCSQAAVQFSCSVVSDFATPWTIARQASLSITNSWSLLKLMSIELVMPSNHLILYHSLLLPPSAFPSIRVFSNESVLSIRRPKC